MALQLAGDYDMRTGLSKLSFDREGGIKLIEKARDSLQAVVDAPATQKSTMLQRRSTFSLAYAYESLGDFEKAKVLYQQLVDAAPDAAFADSARRGVKRTSNPEYVALYEKFKNHEDVLGDAPGPAIPQKPDISFPDLDGSETKTGGGGEFGSEPEKKAPENPVEPEKAATETPAGTDAAGDGK